VGGVGISIVHAHHAAGDVADGDLEQAGLHAEEFVDRTCVHGGDEHRDFVRVVAGAFAQPRLDTSRIAVEPVALCLHELGEHGPHTVVHGSILV
jgi:hypothetical protein